jgi:non-ribosomal peptide synthetase component F
MYCRNLVVVGKNGVFVALITNRCFGMIIGMVGILKSGVTYIPIDN